ncbi:uncharacterized protein LOC113190419 [Urocitellus parryii]
MAPTHTKSTAKVASKRPRRVIDLETKLKLIKDYEGGKSVMVIARQSGMSHSTIATILKNKNKVTEALKGSASLKATRLTKIREGPISDMEKLLMTWIEDQTRKRVPLSTMMITAKAKSLFAMLKEKAGPDYNVEFTASSGWFKRFKNRYSLHNVKGSADVTKECMNGIWKKTLKRFVHDFKGFAQEEEGTNMDKAVVEMANNFTLGMEEDDMEDDMELLEVVPEELTSEESLDQERKAQEKAREKETAKEEKELPRKFTVSGLAEAFTDLNKLLKKFESMDPNPERFSLIEKNVHGALSVYKQIYEAKRKQTTTDIFLRRVTPQEPQAGPSGGIVIIGDDGTMHIIAPEDLPVDHVREGEVSDIDDPDLV